jgi:two-component system cell cycle sensor histidine kinase/response regulator CckA
MAPEPEASPGNVPLTTRAPDPPANPPALRVLVVEDELVIASLLHDVLTSHGYRVELAHTVADGIELARKHDDFALGITDFLLPDRTGLDLARALKQIRPALRLILASAYLEPDLVVKIQAEPTVALIVRKPLDIFELQNRVDELVGRRVPRATPPPEARGGGLTTWEPTC